MTGAMSADVLNSNQRGIKTMKEQEFDILIHYSNNYDWKDNGKYFVGPLINSRGLDVTKKVIAARKKLITYIKDNF